MDTFTGWGFELAGQPCKGFLVKPGLLIVTFARDSSRTPDLCTQVLDISFIQMYPS